MRADRQARRSKRVSVVAGPRLEYAAAEAERVAGLYETPEILDVDGATVEAVIETMGQCDRFHAVAHTRLRDDNPMFSALELADGYLNLYDLEGLESVPDTVVLSACDSAHDNVVGGNEMYGLTSLLLSRGARSIIATVAPIPDSPDSVEAVARIHESLSAGASAAAAVQSGTDRFRWCGGRPLPGLRRLRRLNQQDEPPATGKGLIHSVSEACVPLPCHMAGRTMRRRRTWGRCLT